MPVTNQMLSRYHKMSLGLNNRNLRRRKIAEAMKKRRREELLVLVNKIKLEIFGDDEKSTSDVLSWTDSDPMIDAQDCSVIELIFE